MWGSGFLCHLSWFKAHSIAYSGVLAGVSMLRCNPCCDWPDRSNCPIMHIRTSLLLSRLSSLLTSTSLVRLMIFVIDGCTKVIQGHSGGSEISGKLHYDMAFNRSIFEGCAVYHALQGVGKISPSNTAACSTSRNISGKWSMLLRVSCTVQTSQCFLCELSKGRQIRQPHDASWTHNHKLYHRAQSFTYNQWPPEQGVNTWIPR